MSKPEAIIYELWYNYRIAGADSKLLHTELGLCLYLIGYQETLNAQPWLNNYGVACSLP